MVLLFANNAGSTLALGAAISDTALSLTATGGARFPSPTGGDSFIATIQRGALFEIVECTARSVDTLTVIRAREGTSAQTWSAGATITMRTTAGTMGALEQRSRALASFAPINGPITLTADPVATTDAARKAYVDARDAAMVAQLTPSLTLVGEVKEWAGISPPSRYLFCAGQAVSRATYNELFEAMTRALTVTVVNGSPNVTLTGGDTTNVGAYPISLAGYFPPGTIITNISLPTITLSANATASGSGLTMRVMPYGIGDNSTTFNLPDRRGRVGVGRDNMAGGPVGAMPTGLGFDPYRLGAVGGSALLQSHGHGVNDPGHNHGVNDPGHAHGVTYATSNHVGVGSFVTSAANSPGSANLYNGTLGITPSGTGIFLSPSGTGVSVQASGAGGSQNVQPLQVTHYVIFTNVP